MAKTSKPENETPATTPDEETQTGGDAATPAEQTPAPKPEKSKKGKVEVASDSKPDEADEAEQRLADARNQAVNNHARSQR